MANRSPKMHFALTPEQRAELDAMRAESAAPEARDEEDRVRELVFEEFPPRTLDPSATEALAGLRLARERQGLSLTDMSERTGMPRSMISKLETGNTNPTLVTLERYARALGARLEWSLVQDGAEQSPTGRG